MALLQGAIPFAADLMRAIEARGRHPIYDSLWLESYRDARESSGKVVVRADISRAIEGRPALIVDDVFDSGRTIAYARAHLMAKGATKTLACAFVTPHPDGHWLTELEPEKDPEFAALAAKLAELLKDPVRNAAAIRETEKKMDDRVKELAGLASAEEKAEADKQDALRSAYPMVARSVDPAVETDAEFQQLKAEREKLLADPVGNADAIRALEEAMRDRAAAIAAENEARDGKGDELAAKYPFCVASAEGVPLAELGLLDDGYFLALAAQRDALLEDPEENAAEIACVEEQMRDRVEQVAGDKKKAAAQAEKERAAEEAKYPFVDKAPEGVPLAKLHVDDDDAFRKLAGERALLLRHQRLGVMALCLLGGGNVVQHLSRPAAQVARTELAGPTQKLPLHFDALVVAEPVGELAQGGGDDLCMLEADRTVRELIPGGGQGFEVLGQGNLSSRGGAVGPGVPRQPGSGVHQTGVFADLGRVRRGDESQLHGLQALDRPICLGDQAMKLSGENRRLLGGQPIEGVVHRLQREQNRMRGVGMQIPHRRRVQRVDHSHHLPE